MQLTEMAWRIGKLESGLMSLQARSDDRWGLVMQLLRKPENGNGHARKTKWLQFAAMGTVAVSSLLGIISPEKAATILRALFH